MDAATQFWVVIKNNFGVEDLGFGLEECEISHTLTTTATGSKISQKEVNNQIDNKNQCSVPPKDPSLQALGLV